MHLVLNLFIFTRTLVTHARTIFKPRCCLNFQSMRTQTESTDIAFNMFGQIKMEIPWYINRHTLVSRKRGGKPRMISGQFVVVRVSQYVVVCVSQYVVVCVSQFVVVCVSHFVVVCVSHFVVVRVSQQYVATNKQPNLSIQTSHKVCVCVCVCDM